MLLRYVQKYHSSYIFSEFKRYVHFLTLDPDLERNSTMISKASSTTSASLPQSTFPPGCPSTPSIPVSSSPNLCFQQTLSTKP